MLWNYATTSRWKISPPHVLVGSLYGWSLCDLQTRRFYYSTPQRAKRPRSWLFLSMVCSDVEIEPVLQDISGEHFNRGSNKAQDARLDIPTRGFQERHQPAFFDVRVCHPNAVSYRNLEPLQIRIHENEKKRLYSMRVLDIEHAWNIYTFGFHHNWRNGKGVLDVS